MAPSPGPMLLSGRFRAFTLVELLVAMAILGLMMVLVFSIINQTGKLWQSTTGKTGAFQQARMGFETMTRNLTQATLNTYFDYDTPAAPTIYVRQSELHIICGPAASLITANTTWSGETGAVRPTHGVFFQAPLGFDSSAAGLNRLLNASGYYLEFNSDTAARPAFLRNRPGFPPRYRYRLMELSESSGNLLIYHASSLASKGWPAYNTWFNNAIGTNRARPVAENIVALILTPKLSPADPGNLAPEYRYDSRFDPVATGGLYTSATPAATRVLHRHQLPPMIQVTMVAIDELSAARLAAKHGETAPKLVEENAFALASAYSSGDPASPADLESLQDSLAQQGVAYRTFSTNVSLRGAKWSNN